MKKLIMCFVIILFSVSAIPVHAEYSSKAYGGTGKESFMVRTSDWFATLGKSQEDQYRIKHERRTARKIEKAKKRINKKKKSFAKKKGKTYKKLY